MNTSKKTAHDLLGVLVKIADSFGANDSDSLRSNFDEYTHLASSMLANGSAQIVFQESVSLQLISEMAAKAISKSDNDHPESLVRVVMERAPITQALAHAAVMRYPNLAPIISNALLASSFELNASISSRHDRSIDTIDHLRRHPQGQAGKLMTVLLNSEPTHIGTKGCAYELLHCVGRLPSSEVTQELRIALMAHEECLLADMQGLARRTPAFSTPSLMLGAYRMGSTELKQLLFDAKQFTDVELYEMALLAQEPLEISPPLAQSYLEIPGETSTFMAALFLGNRSLDVKVLGALYVEAWTDASLTPGGAQMSDPEATFVKIVEAYKLLTRLELLSEHRLAGLLDHLLSSLQERNPLQAQALYEHLLSPSIPSSVMLKTHYARQRPDAVLEVDLGL